MLYNEKGNVFTNVLLIIIIVLLTIIAYPIIKESDKKNKLAKEAEIAKDAPNTNRQCLVGELQIFGNKVVQSHNDLSETVKSENSGTSYTAESIATILEWGSTTKITQNGIYSVSIRYDNKIMIKGIGNEIGSNGIDNVSAKIIIFLDNESPLSTLILN